MSRLFVPLLILSFMVAVAADARLLLGGSIADPVWIAYGWVALFVFALIVFRWRGLWFLIGAPFALGPAIFIYWYVATCVPTKSCL